MTDRQLAIPPRMLRLPCVAGAAGDHRAVRRHRQLCRRARRRCSSSSARSLVTALFTLAARRRASGLAAAWLATSVAGFALFIAFTFGVLHAALADRLAGAAHRRGGRAAAPLRHRPGRRRRLPRAEHHFVLGRGANTNVETIAGWMAGGEDGIAVVEDRWQADLAKALAARRAPRRRRASAASRPST